MKLNEESVFTEALAKTDPRERAAFLDQACAGDPTLRESVDSLLAAHQAGSFLENPAVERPGEKLKGQSPGNITQAESPTDLNDSSLDFLAPSEKPDSLGRLQQYEILEVIGRGGMGTVLRAFDDKLHRVVAIKVMAAQLATNGTARKRFTREAQAQAAVSHDHIVTIHAVEEVNGLPYLVMQYVAGMSLQQRLDRGGPLALHEILRIGMQTASGLVAAHAQGLIHRDTKPANILLENGVERVKITDFGLARAAADASLTQSGVVAGTPHYMSPEQAEGKAIDQRTDLFSLGSVLYAMCTGRPPFRATTTMAVLKRVCEETPKPIRETNPEIPDWLIAIIDKLHAKDPAERYQSAAEVAELLGRHLAQVQHPSVAPLPRVGPTARGTGDRGRAWSRRRWAIAATVFLGLLAGLSLIEATGVTNLRSTVIRIFTPAGPVIVEPDVPGVKAEKQDPDRHAAEWVLSIGGAIMINENGKEREIGNVGDMRGKERKSGGVGDLPGGAFKLTWVNLDGNPKVDDAGLAHFKDCKNLTMLNLAYNQVADAGLAHLKDCKKLRYLHLANTHVTDVGLAHFKDCKNLEKLVLTNTSVGDAGLAHFKDCKKLTVLDLDGTQVSDAGLAHFKDRKNLTLLKLAGTNVSDDGLALFKDCKNLTILDLHNTDVSDAGLAHFKHCKNLTALGLQATNASDDGLAHFKHCKMLDWLYLGDTQVSDAGLAHFKDCKNLTQLELHSTQVSDAGLAQFKDCKKLILLNLAGIKVSDVGLAYFKDCKNLTQLYVHDTQVSDTGLAHFKDCKTLLILTLQKTKVTAAGIDELKKALPQCKIEWDGGVIDPPPKK